MHSLTEIAGGLSAIGVNLQSLSSIRSACTFLKQRLLVKVHLTAYFTLLAANIPT